MSSNWKYNFAQFAGCFTWIALAALIIVAALMKGCAGWKMSEIHLGYAGAGLDLEFETHTEAEFHFTLPIEPAYIEDYIRTANKTKIRVNRQDSSQIYQLIGDHPVVYVDSIHRLIFIPFSYQRIK